jgi:hypothetical protein
MTTDLDTPDSRTDADRDIETEPRAERLSGELNSVVVSYEDGPDRRTIYPEATSGVERMSMWLTADDTGFVELESFR